MRIANCCLALSAAALIAAIACGSPAPGANAGATPGGATVNTARGQTLYKANCVACHGETGKGDGPGAGVLKPPPRDHTDAGYMGKLSDQEIADIIRMGGAPKNMPQMPSHPQINGNDLASLVAYVRSLSRTKTGN